MLSGLPILALNTGQVTSAKSFVSTAVSVEGMFNFLRRPPRHRPRDGRAAADPVAGHRSSLPTVGTGEYEWRGFLGAKAHPQTVSPESGAILDWNSAAPRRVGAPPTTTGPTAPCSARTSYRRAGRRQAERGGGRGRFQQGGDADLRVMEVWPAIADVLATAPAPSPLVRTAADLLTAWRAAGGSRLDRDLDGRIDHPGAAVMDAAWPLIARAVMSRC